MIETLKRGNYSDACNCDQTLLLIHSFALMAGNKVGFLREKVFLADFSPCLHVLSNIASLEMMLLPWELRKMEPSMAIALCKQARKYEGICCC